MEFEYVEERLAQRVIERFGLSPPIDPHELAERYATIKLCEFPVDVDGVTVGLKQPGTVPRIYLNKKISKRRRRFTLAHELGHVLIPRHIGTIVDDLEIRETGEHSRYWEMEGEANRFASELLMPKSWVRRIWDESNTIASAVRNISESADVSVDAAVLRAIKLGPPGHIIIRSEDGNLIWGGKTGRTLTNIPVSGMRVSGNLISPAIYYEELAAYDATYHCWGESPEVQVPVKPREDSRDILERIIQEINPRYPVKLRQSINGIIGFANGSTREGRTREKLYAACLHRTRNRSDSDPDMALIFSHPRFDEYLQARVYELML